MPNTHQEYLAPTLYYDRHFMTDAVKIMPGEYFVTQREMLLVTVLGSCVAACIRDRKRGMAGMNHFMLPDSGADNDNLIGAPTRYGAYAMEVLINHLLKLGAKRQDLEAKIFGGGAVMEQLISSQVGERNVSFVRRFLDTEKIPVIAEDLLGEYPRKVYYFGQSGRVLLKKIRTIHNNTIAAREKEYVARLRDMSVSGDAELF